MVFIYISGSQTLLVRGPLIKIWWSAKDKILIFIEDSRSTSAHLADHQWSTEQTLGITDLYEYSVKKVHMYSCIFSSPFNLK